MSYFIVVVVFNNQPHAVKQETLTMNKRPNNKIFSLAAVSTMVLSLSACQSHHHTHDGVNGSHSHAHESVALPAQAPFAVDKQQFCEDFLSKLNKKPMQLKFEGCSAGFYANHHSVIANYRVAGKHAFDVQEFLHRVSGMPRLVKDCCTWESTNPTTGKIGGVIREQGQTYFVRMESKELRLGWGPASDIENIAEFQVQAIYPLQLNLGEKAMVE